MTLRGDVDLSPSDIAAVLDPWRADDEPVKSFDTVLTSRLIAGAKRHGVMPMMEAAIRDGRFVPDAATIDAVIRANDELQSATVTVDALCAAAIHVLERAGVEVIVLKGVAVSSLDYPDRELRTYRDADLLIRGEAVGGAVASLEPLGLSRLHREPFRGFDSRFTKGVVMRAPRHEVDLHRTLALGVYGLRIPIETLWTDNDEFVLGARRCRALSPLRRFVHAALHMGLRRYPTLLGAFDLRTIYDRNGLTAVDVQRLSSEWNVELPVRRAVLVADSMMVAGSVDRDLVRWAASDRGTRWERTLLDAYVGRRASSRSITLTSLVGLRRVSDQFRFLLGHGGRVFRGG